MKIVTGLVLGLLVALLPPSARAGDFCIAETVMSGTDHLVWKAFTIPAKGTCKPVVAITAGEPGLLFSGTGCTTTDGKTLLFTLFWGFVQNIANQQGSITLASHSGSFSGVNLSNGGGSSFSGGTISVESCPKKPTPITAENSAGE